jgi:hypothetical protein
MARYLEHSSLADRVKAFAKAVSETQPGAIVSPTIFRWHLPLTQVRNEVRSPEFLEVT